jgi:hypothetical protein
MSQSQWLGQQTGNFSNDKNDSFDPDKGYIGIRLQQGVPLLDRDWNELEDIRRHADVQLNKNYIGGGTPDNGFAVSPTEPPALDFRIAAGRCMVDGFDVVNAPPENKDFILFSQQPDAQDLSKLAADKEHAVYIDAWVREVNAAMDKDLANSQDIKVETAIRHQLVWRVRVADGDNYTKEDFHHYYPIAKIKAGADKKITLAADLRVTGLTLANIKESVKSASGGQQTFEKLNITRDLVFDGSPNRKISGESRKGSDAVVVMGRWNELEIKGRVIDWTGSNLHFGYQNDHSAHNIFFGNGKLKTVSIQGKTDLVVEQGNVKIGDWEITGSGTTLEFKTGGKSAVKFDPNGLVGAAPAGGGAPQPSQGSLNLSGVLSFTTKTRQMINLWRAEYGIGIQAGTQYYRTAKNFAFYKGGKHSDKELDAGGGAPLLVLRNGRVGIGTNNPQGILHVVGDIRVDKDIVKTKDYGITVGGTNTNHRVRLGELWGKSGVYGLSGLRLGSNDKEVRVGGGNTLHVEGHFMAGNSDIYFTKKDHKHTGIGNTEGYAAIENAINYNALMILGRSIKGKGRHIKMYDHVEVSGTLKAPGMLKFSDARFKKDIKALPKVLKKLDQLQGIYFKWNDHEKVKDLAKTRNIGMIADEVEKVFPELITTDDEGFKYLEYDNFSVVLLEAVKEQQATIDALKKRLDKLEKKKAAK